MNRRGLTLSTTLVMFLALSLPINSQAMGSQHIVQAKATVVLAPPIPLDPMGGGAPGASEFKPICLPITDTGPRVQAVYVYDETKPISQQDLSNIRLAMEESDRIVFLSADKQGGGRRLRINTETYGLGCRVLIDYLPMSHSFFLNGASDGSQIMQTLISRKIIIDPNQGDPNNTVSNSNGIIPVTFVNSDPNSLDYCGIGDSPTDDSPTGVNSQPSSNLAIVWKTCWNAYTTIHEVMHTLGAVQATAPNATNGGHCTDGIDIMCYDDSSGSSRSSTAQKVICLSSDYRPGGLLDCNANDYFSINPTPGSYLATHYNVANNSPYILKTDSSNVAWPTISIIVDPKTKTIPFVGVPFTATVTAPGGLLFVGSNNSYGNDNCGVSLTSKIPPKGTDTSFTVSGVAYCRTNNDTIRNVNNVLVGPISQVVGSHISVADLMGRDSFAPIKFAFTNTSIKLALPDTLKMFPFSLAVKDTYTVSMPTASNNFYVVKVNIKGRVPGAKATNTPLVGLAYLVLDQTKMREVPQSGIYSQDVVSDASGNMYFKIPASLAGHLIDFENDSLDGNILWQLPVTQIKMPVIKKKP